MFDPCGDHIFVFEVYGHFMSLIYFHRIEAFLIILRYLGGAKLSWISNSLQ